MRAVYSPPIWSLLKSLNSFLSVYNEKFCICLDLLLIEFPLFFKRFVVKLFAFFTLFDFESAPIFGGGALNETLLCWKWWRDELFAGGLGALKPAFLFNISVKWSLILFLCVLIEVFYIFSFSGEFDPPELMLWWRMC